LTAAGSGVEVGGDALESSRARLSPSPWPAGEVGDLALDDGAVGPVPGLPGGIGLFLRARCKMASQGWIVIVRPRRDVVQLWRIGQFAQ